MKKKELIKLLEGVNDETEIICPSDNYELGNSYVRSSATISNYKKVEKQFRDDFDGTRYTSTVYEYDENAEKVVIIRGF